MHQSLPQSLPRLSTVKFLKKAIDSMKNSKTLLCYDSMDNEMDTHEENAMMIKKYKQKKKNHRKIRIKKGTQLSSKSFVIEIKELPC